jgi:type I site-specific restriction endonuclease
MKKKRFSPFQTSFGSQGGDDIFSHQQIYEKLREGFEDNPARVMSETLIQLVGQQNDKLTRSIDRFTKSLEQTVSRMVSKADLEESLSKMASKEDLQEMVSKADLAESLSKMASKKDLREMVSKADLKEMAWKEDLEKRFSQMVSKEYLHQELHAQTRFISALLVAWSGLIIGVVYFLIEAHMK